MQGIDGANTNATTTGVDTNSTATDNNSVNVGIDTTNVDNGGADVPPQA